MLGSNGKKEKKSPQHMVVDKLTVLLLCSKIKVSLVWSLFCLSATMLTACLYHAGLQSTCILVSPSIY